MSLRELKQKIVQISMLYKAERVRTKQMDGTIKSMEPQIANTMQLSSLLNTQKNTIQTLQ